MKSLRDMVNCIRAGIPLLPKVDISVLEDFWGYTRHPDAETIKEVGEAGLSLLRQAELLQGKHMNLNLIRVGNDQFHEVDEQDINNAIYMMREIYATARLGVSGIQHRGIPTILANGHDVIDEDQEARDLTNEWTVPNWAVDVFIVLDSWTGDNGRNKRGLSKTDGPCWPKDFTKRMSGSVIALQRNVITGIVLAHEVGHYLGLSHIGDLESEDVADLPNTPFTDVLKRNLMFPSLRRRTVEILPDQAAEMKDHCFVMSGCP